MKAIKRISTLAAALLIATMSLGSIAFASETSSVPDLPDGKFMLSIQMACNDETGELTEIVGADVSIFKVASVTAENNAANYTLEKGFKTEIDFENMTAENSMETAEKLAAEVKQLGMKGLSKKSDEGGIADFSELDPGMYLVVLNGYSEDDSLYMDMKPFLVLVPGIDTSGEENVWVSSVTVAPKIAILPKTIIEVDPPVIKTIEGTPDEDAVFEFELRAEDITNPMPAGSREGIKTCSVKGAGETEFGIWQYTEPGVYRYTAVELNTGDSNYEYDETVFTLEHTVYYEGTELKVDTKLTDQNGVESDDAAFNFVNKYIEAEQPPAEPNEPGENTTTTGFFNSPKTGDITNPALWIICLLAGGAFVVMAILRRRCD